MDKLCSRAKLLDANRLVHLQPGATPGDEVREPVVTPTPDLFLTVEHTVRFPLVMPELDDVPSRAKRELLVEGGASGRERLLDEALVAGPADGESILLLEGDAVALISFCLLYTSPSPRDLSTSRMPSSA